MDRRRLLLLLILSMAVTLGFGGYALHQQQSGEEALLQAEMALATPFEEAPELHALPVAEAAEALDRAEDCGVAIPRALAQEVTALEYLTAGDLIFAEGSLDEVRQATGWTPRLRVMAAAIARANADIEGAWQHVRAASSLAPTDGRALLMTADLALDRNDGRAATSALRRLVMDHGELAPLHNRLGLALELVEEWSQAEAAFERAVSLDEDHHVAWINLGRRRRADGRLEASLAAFEEATALQSGDADAWLGRGLVALELGRFDDAEAALNRADELAPHQAHAQVALGDLALAQGEQGLAIDAYRTALRRREDLPETWLKLGNALVREADFVGAERAYRQALHHNERLAAAHNGLGTSLLGQGNYEAAEHALQMAAQLDEADPNPWMNLALLRERTGATGDARDAWQAALARDPNATVARERLARLDG